MALTPSLAPGAPEAIEAFVHDHVEDSGAKGIVCGLSGGIDSALVAALAARAIGPSRVTCFYLPIEAVGGTDARDARAVAKRLKVKLFERDLTGAYRALAQELEVRDRRSRGNLKARPHITGDS